jgi:hypothetical protein
MLKLLQVFSNEGSAICRLLMCFNVIKLGEIIVSNIHTRALVVSVTIQIARSKQQAPSTCRS